MQTGRTTVILLLMTIQAFTPGVVSAEEPVFSSTDVQALLRRLDDAEAKIGTLEHQLNAAPPSARLTHPPQLEPTSESSFLLDSVQHAPYRSVAGSAPADEPAGTFEEMLAKMDARWKKQEEINEEFAAGLKNTLAPGTSGATMKWTGRIHLDSWSFSDDSPGIHAFENPATGVDPEDRVFFRRLRLGVEGKIRDNVLYKLEMDFNKPSLGEMKDNYIGFTDLPFLQLVLIGNQKRPLGLDHLNSSRYNVFIERPLVVEAFNEDARRIGIASYGVSDDEVYNWRYGFYFLENPVDDGQIIGDSRQGSFNARLAGVPWYDESSGGRGYFHWAIAGMVARPDGDADPRDTNANLGRFRTRAELRSDRRWIDTGPIAGAEWYEILGLESIINVGPLQIVGEYQTTWLQRDDSTPGTGPDVFFHGAYVYAAYMLTGEHVPLERDRSTIGRVKPFENFFLVERCGGGHGGGWGAWQLAARYSYLDLTDNDIRGGVEHNVTGALVWYFNPNASLQFNAVYGDIDDHAPVRGFTGGHFTALGTRVRVDF